MDLGRRLDTFVRTLRYAARGLARTPGVTLTVILTLAIGIGASTTVFSALNAVLLRPLPFPDADRLMRLKQTQPRSAESYIAPIRIEDWNRLNGSFTAITGYYGEDASETSGDVPERVRRAFVAPRFFDVWGVSPVLGRGFVADEQRSGGPPAVVVSDRYWKRRFPTATRLSGASVRIGNASVPIVGVMPASFLFPDRDVDLWFPTPLSPALEKVRYATWYTGVGRLKPGVTVEQARADLAAVQTRLGEQFPDTDRTIGVMLTPLKEAAVGEIRASLWMLFGAVSVLLLIACTNIAAVLLGRAAQRGPEIAVRLSLGASRTAIAVQVLIETLLLALAGGVIGLLAAAAGSAAVRSLQIDLPRMDEVVVDRQVLLFTFSIVVLVALLCGLLPALRATRDGLLVSRGAGRTHTGSRHTLQWLLVGVQVGLSVTLLAGAGLLVRSLHELWRLDAGFDPTRVLAFRVSGNWGETAQYERLVQRIDRLLDEMRALPGVQSAATSLFAPGVPATFESQYEIVERRGPASERLPAESRFVSPDYFATLQIPLLDGRSCREVPLRAPREVMVNRAFARRFLADTSSPIGLHVATDAGSRPAQIVGIVGNARERGLDRDPVPIVYTCFNAPNPTPYVLLRTSGDPAALIQAVRARVNAIEPQRAVYDIAPLGTLLGDAFTQNRLRAGLVAVFAASALVLACVGLYGTLSYAVNLRRREIGLRLALGAMRRDIIRRYVTQVLLIASAASVCGLALARALSGVMAGMLVGVSPGDPLTLAGVTALVLLVAGIAALVPATRAALVEPMRVLRDE
jgi:putative ABC transport system permease protein